MLKYVRELRMGVTSKKSRGLLREGPPLKFAWIQTEKATYPLSKLCRWLGVTRSGFYAWQQRPASPRSQEDRRLKVLVRASFTAARGYYGSPRVHDDLLEWEERVSRKRVMRLMQEEGLQPRRTQRIAKSTPGHPWRP